VLSRQNVPHVTQGDAVGSGAAEVGHEPAPEIVLLGTGSEVSVCVEAAETLRSEGRRVRVVSMPSWDRFALQSEAYRLGLLPPNVPTLSVEAASTFGWSRYATHHVGIDRFGASAPGSTVMERLGISAVNVVSTSRSLLG
jgi:transketolase